PIGASRSFDLTTALAALVVATAGLAFALAFQTRDPGVNPRLQRATLVAATSPLLLFSELATFYLVEASGRTGADAISAGPGTFLGLLGSILAISGGIRAYQRRSNAAVRWRFWLGG